MTRYFFDNLTNSFIYQLIFPAWAGYKRCLETIFPYLQMCVAANKQEAMTLYQYKFRPMKRLGITFNSSYYLLTV